MATFNGNSTAAVDTDTFLAGCKIVLGVPDDYKFAIGDLAAYLGLSTTSVVANADLLAQTTNNTLWDYVTLATGTYQMSGYLNVTAYTSGTITLRVSWVDENGITHSGVAFSAGVTATGYVFINPVNLRALTGTHIQATVTCTATAVFDCGVTLQRIA